jgi:hypothetical protein
MQSPSNVISAWITGLNVGQRTWKRNHGIINVMTRSYWWLSRLRISRSPQATQFTDKTVRSMCPPSVNRSRFSLLIWLDSLDYANYSCIFVQKFIRRMLMCQFQITLYQSIALEELLKIGFSHNVVRRVPKPQIRENQSRETESSPVTLVSGDLRLSG